MKRDTFFKIHTIITTVDVFACEMKSWLL